jgi:hypothetical protein
MQRRLLGRGTDTIVAIRSTATVKPLVVTMLFDRDFLGQ